MNKGDINNNAESNLETNKLPKEVGGKLESTQLPSEVGNPAETNTLPNEMEQTEDLNILASNINDLSSQVVDSSGNDLAENNIIKLESDSDLSKIKDNEGNLLPNITYEINNYTYITDAQGRIVSAEGKLQKKDHDGKKKLKATIEEVGKGDQKEGDQRGHLIADRFNGGSSVGNLSAMSGELNQGAYAKMENTLAAAVKDGKEVYYKVEPQYSGNSNRPTGYKVEYTINGEKTVEHFKN